MKIDQSEAERELESLINDVYSSVREKIKKEEEEMSKTESDKKKDDAPDPVGT